MGSLMLGFHQGLRVKEDAKRILPLEVQVSKAQGLPKPRFSCKSKGKLQCAKSRNEQMDWPLTVP